MKLLLNTAGEPTQESLDLRRELAEVVSEVKAQWAAAERVAPPRPRGDAAAFEASWRPRYAAFRRKLARDEQELVQREQQRRQPRAKKTLIH